MCGLILNVSNVLMGCSVIDAPIDVVAYISQRKVVDLYYNHH